MIDAHGGYVIPGIINHQMQEKWEEALKSGRSVYGCLAWR